MKKTDRPSEKELLALWERMSRINPDPMQAAKSYARVMAALRWYIENDDVNLGEQGNEYWEANYHRGKKVYRDASGVDLRQEDDDPNIMRQTIYVG